MHLISDLERRGRTVVLVAVDGQLVAGAALLDAVRPESHLVVDALKAMGIEVHCHGQCTR
jgi:Cu+-exporting ATPase